MIRKSALLLAVVALLATAAVAEPESVYFSLSTDQTFRPDQKPTINLYARNVDVLEFRVYRVNDPVAFFSGLEDKRSFGVQRYSPRERVDERTTLERFHDWKLGWWRWVRDLVRGQYSAQSRATIRERNSERAKRTSVSGAAGFANVPVLNEQQLVARWRLDLPPKYVSESAPLPLEKLPSALYVVEATDGTYRAYTVLIVSEMALVTKTAANQVVAFTVDRKTGASVSGANVTVWRKRAKVAELVTSAEGMAEAVVPEAATKDGTESEEDEENFYESSNWIMAQRGDDVAVVAPYYLRLSSNPHEDWTGFVYTDRPVYRPGHTVQIKAILRKRAANKLLLPSERQAEVTIEDASGNPVLKRSYGLTPFGSLSATLELPETAALGYYSISVGVAQSRIGGSFEVQEYKKPEYFVKVTPERPRVLQGDSFKATIEARYYFGEPVTQAKVKYVVHTQRAYYWEGDDDSEMAEGDEEGYDGYFYGQQVSEEEGKLDANGRLVVTIPTEAEDKGKFDVTYRIEARVTDQGNREVSGQNSVLATYGTFRLNVSTGSYLYRKGENIAVVVKAADYEKRPIQTDLKVELLKRTYGYSGTEELAYTGTARTGSDGYARFEVPAQVAGSAVLKVTAVNTGGREVEARTWLWIVGEGESTWGEGTERQLQVIADKGSYKVGDVARLVVMGVTKDASVYVTTEGRTVMTRRLLKAAGDSVTVEVPVTTEAQPNFYVSAFMVSDDKFYSGDKNVRVPPVERTLKIAVAPSKQQFQPGEPASYNIQVTDSDGKPVAAEVSLGVVDDAIYAVRPESSGNIVSAFYGERYGDVQTNQSFTFYFHGEAGTKPMQLAGGVGAFSLGAATPGRALAQVKANEFVQPKIRKAFPDTAFWAPTIVTDAGGRATARLNFPDSLTTWRATVRAVTADTKAGATTHKVLVRKNLMVRLAVPRFFRQGDEVTVSTIVHNYLDTTKTVRMSLGVTGLQVVSGATQQVSVQNRGEAKVDWRLRTMPGQRSATLLAKALTNEESDAMELTLPVVPFGVKQSVANAGAITEASAQRSFGIGFPAGVEASSRGIDVEITPSIAGAVFEGLEYLTSYPYGCTEQTMSSFLPNVVVASTLRELKVPSRIDPNRLKRQVDAGFERLYGFQHEDGGWGWWKDDDSMVFMTAYVISGMAQAQAAGFEVRPNVLDNGKAFLRKALDEHPRMIADLRAYVVYALALTGERKRESLDKVWDSRENLTSEGIALAGLAMHLSGDPRANEAAALLKSRSQSEGDAVSWPSGNDNLLEISVDNSAEATAYAVKLLSLVSPSDDLLPKAILWMMRNRRDGYWYSTKQTAMVLFGITEYLKVSRELEAAFNAEVYVNGKQVLTRKFTSNDATTGATAVARLPFNSVGDNNTIEVRKSGTGRLYWNVRGNYYTTSPSAYDRNGLKLSIARQYFKMVSEKQGDEIAYSLVPLSGPVQTGDLLAIRVTVTGDRWKYMMVEDPIPAGTEFVERDELYRVKDKPRWWHYSHSNREFRDDRAVMFSTSYYDPVNEYFYLVKVTNAGMFRISPATAQPMYQPDVISTTEPVTMEVK